MHVVEKSIWSVQMTGKGMEEAIRLVGVGGHWNDISWLIREWSTWMSGWILMNIEWFIQEFNLILFILSLT